MIKNEVYQWLIAYGDIADLGQLADLGDDGQWNYDRDIDGVKINDKCEQFE